jgi:hypothetical protein
MDASASPLRHTLVSYHMLCCVAVRTKSDDQEKENGEIYSKSALLRRTGVFRPVLGIVYHVCSSFRTLQSSLGVGSQHVVAYIHVLLP